MSSVLETPNRRTCSFERLLSTDRNSEKNTFFFFMHLRHCWNWLHVFASFNQLMQYNDVFFDSCIWWNITIMTSWNFTENATLCACRRLLQSISCQPLHSSSNCSGCCDFKCLFIWAELRRQIRSSEPQVNAFNVASFRHADGVLKVQRCNPVMPRQCCSMTHELRGDCGNIDWVPLTIHIDPDRFSQSWNRFD